MTICRRSVYEYVVAPGETRVAANLRSCRLRGATKAGLSANFAERQTSIAFTSGPSSSKGESATVAWIFGYHYALYGHKSRFKIAAVARLEKFGDALVTGCTKMQQTKERLSLNGAVSYNVSAC
jgi:hypothetical protein